MRFNFRNAGVSFLILSAGECFGKIRVFLYPPPAEVAEEEEGVATTLELSILSVCLGCLRIPEI